MALLMNDKLSTLISDINWVLAFLKFYMLYEFPPQPNKLLRYMQKLLIHPISKSIELLTLADAGVVVSMSNLLISVYVVLPSG